MKRRIFRCLGTLLLVLAAAAPAAAAGSFEVVFRDYQRDGTIDACKFTAKQLAEAKRQVPNDIQQYAPDFPAALDAAAERRASRRCKKGAATGAAGSVTGGAGTAGAPGGPGAAGAAGAGDPAAPGAAGATPAPGAPNAPGQTPGPAGTPKATPAVSDRAIQAAAARGDDDGFPLALAIAAGVLLLLGLLLAAARWWAWEPRVLVRSRHAGGEAGWRMGLAWSEFADWVRLGR